MKLRELKCNNCGAKLNIKEKDKIVKCEFCNSTYSIEENDRMEVISPEEFTQRFRDTVKNQSKAIKAVSIFMIVIFICIFLFVGAMIAKSFVSMGEHENNAVIEMYNGSQSGAQVGWLLDEVTGQMDKNDRKFTIVFLGDEYTDVDDIRAIKKELETFKEYEVILHYNKKKIIDKITITE